MASSSPHYVGVSKDEFVIPGPGGTFTIKPQALSIIWGGDDRYWRKPTKLGDPVELLQVSWLEVSGSLPLAKLEENKEYMVSFKISMKPDAFGWVDSPVYLMAKPGNKSSYFWKNADLSLCKPEQTTYNIPKDKILKFKVPKGYADGDKLLFGMYEIWKGRWKGGLLIHEVLIEPVPPPSPN